MERTKEALASNYASSEPITAVPCRLNSDDTNSLTALMTVPLRTFFRH